ncbi:MAG: protein kinase domain-containing protein, partial [Phycisphaerae bacterium]
MEFVDGLELHTYAQQQDLPLRHKLELVAQICDAVQHAHTKGVIHRDLKPQNILIESDSNGSLPKPRVLDFGVARVTDVDVRAATLQTDVGQLIGTLAYMSPEQVTGDSRSIDTRSDVYSLGVILFELLSGHLPLNVRGRSLPEAVRMIKEEPASTIVTYNASLRGDIDTIVRKALEKDREQRYGTAAEFAADIRRFLKNEPVTARPPSTLYQLTKFARRNRALIGGLAATILALVVGLTLALFSLLEANRQRDQKQIALEQKEVALSESYEVSRFFNEMFKYATPTELGKDVPARQILDKAAIEVETQFADQPILEARVRTTLGSIFVTLSEYDKAATQLDRAEEIWDSLPARYINEKLKNKINKATLLFYTQEMQSSLKYYDDVIAQLQQQNAAVPDDDLDIDTLKAKRAFTALRAGRYEEARTGFEQSTNSLLARWGADAETTINAESLYAEFLSVRGDKRAEPLYRDLIERAGRVFGIDHPETILLKGNLAACLRGQNRFEESLELLNEVYASQKEILGESHRQTLISASSLGQAMATAGQIDRASELVESAITVSNASHGESSPTTRFLTFALGAILSKGDDKEKAARVLKNAVDLFQREEGPNAVSTLRAETELMNHYLSSKQPKNAAALGQKIMERLLETSQENDPRLYKLRYDLARAYMGSGRLEEAEDMLLLAAEEASPLWLAAIKRRLVALYDFQGRSEEADKWRAKPKD